MAAATLDLTAGWQAVTLEATATNLREVVLPAGTRSLLMESDSDFRQQDTGTDGGPSDISISGKFAGGAQWSWRVPGSGIGAEHLTEPRSLYFWGTVSAQVVRMRVQREA
jgi:hypothetical protein